MKWLILGIIFFNFITYGNEQQLYFSSSQQDFRQEKLQSFFERYNSPLNAKEFIEASDKYNLDWKLLVSVAGAESTFGRNYIHNPFGWYSDKIPASVDYVASKIATLSYYKKYREEPTLRNFSISYNQPYAETYEQKLKYFYDQLK